MLKLGMSSLRMRLKSMRPAPDEEYLGDLMHDMVDPSVYKCHGGGFPVRVRNVEGIVGVIAVSGLKSEDDNGVIVDGIREYLARNK